MSLKYIKQEGKPADQRTALQGWHSNEAAERHEEQQRRKKELPIALAREMTSSDDEKEKKEKKTKKSKKSKKDKKDTDVEQVVCTDVTTSLI